jgi:hypothetical protein
MRLIYANGETVQFSFDDGKESIFGSAFVEMYSSSVYTLKFCKDVEIRHDSKYDIDVMVHGNQIIGTGSRKYRYSIMESINEFKKGNHDGNN